MKKENIIAIIGCGVIIGNIEFALYMDNLVTTRIIIFADIITMSTAFIFCLLQQTVKRLKITKKAGVDLCFLLKKGKRKNYG